MKNYLLLQCRLDSDPMRDHERDCVARAMKVAPEQVEQFNLTQGLPSAQRLEQAAALMIGGSGAFHVYDSDVWVLGLIDWCKELLQNVDRPVLGMCFGHQAMLKASGAAVINDMEREELGTYELSLTQDGAADPLFAGIPKNFYAQLGHVDRAASLPEGWLNLVDSPSQPNQAVRLTGLPVWGFQFHAELRMQDNLYRVRHYAEHYGAAREEVFEALKARHRPSPKGTDILQNFASIVEQFWEKNSCTESSYSSPSL
jgi:GMP synthase (glutamine-hydrolysing)